MARALRVEYPNARYHIMCRGNQSRDIFQSQEDADLFVRCLGEMCVRSKCQFHLFILFATYSHAAGWESCFSVFASNKTSFLQQRKGFYSIERKRQQFELNLFYRAAGSHLGLNLHFGRAVQIKAHGLFTPFFQNKLLK